MEYWLGDFPVIFHIYPYLCRNTRIYILYHVQNTGSINFVRMELFVTKCVLLTYTTAINTTVSTVVTWEVMLDYLPLILNVAEHPTVALSMSRLRDKWTIWKGRVTDCICRQRARPLNWDQRVRMSLASLAKTTCHPLWT